MCVTYVKCKHQNLCQDPFIVLSISSFNDHHLTMHTFSPIHSQYATASQFLIKWLRSYLVITKSVPLCKKHLNVTFQPAFKKETRSTWQHLQMNCLETLQIWQHCSWVDLYGNRQ